MTTLAVLAAGRSTRYGAPKQLTPVGPADEVLMDYAVHDALSAGVNSVVLIVNDDVRDAANRHAARWPCDTSLVTQNPNPTLHRRKPYGTGEAALLAARHIDGPFVLINGDDFYGSAITTAVRFSVEQPRAHALVAFELVRTLSGAGGVSRGVVTGPFGRVDTITEHVEVRREDDGVIRGNVIGDPSRNPIDPDAAVSMNLWCFGTGAADPFGAAFDSYLQRWADHPEREFLIGDAVRALIAPADMHLQLLRASNRWFGLTHPDDHRTVVAELVAAVERGEYPSPLFEV